MIHFEFTFVYYMSKGFRFIFVCTFTVFPYFQRLFFTYWIILELVKNHTIYVWLFLNSFFFCSIYLYTWLYALITIAFWWVLKSSNVSPPTLFFSKLFGCSRLFTEPLSGSVSFPLFYVWWDFKNLEWLFLLGAFLPADGDWSHEIKRRLLPGRKVMTNLDRVLKSRDITLPTKVHLVKVMVFPVVMYGCESWTVKKAECRKIDAFELCGVGEDSWESLGLRGDPTSPS